MFLWLWLKRYWLPVARATGVAIPYQIVDRRAGDLPEFWADAQLAETALGWSAKRDLDAMMEDTWRWQSANPKGFR